MRRLTHKIKDALGIHARPAGLLVRLCMEFKSDIRVRKNDKAGNAKQIFPIMALSAKCGEEIEITITGEDEKAAFEAIEKFLQETL